MKTVVYSAIESRKGSNGSDVVERIYLVDQAGTVVEKLKCENRGISMCAGQPGLSPQGKRMVFVSDRDRPQHYSLYVANENSEIDSVPMPASRFAAYPLIGSTTGAIYVLLANSFTRDSRPELELWKLAIDGDNERLITKEDMGFGKSAREQ